MSDVGGFSAPLCVAALLIVAAALAETGEESEVTVTFSADRTEVIRQGESFIKRYEGNVVVRMNPEVWLTADEATYSAPDREARLLGHVTIVDSGRTLKADRATYLFKEHPHAAGRPLVRLRGDVSLEDTSRGLTAASADYRPDADSVVAIGRVRGRQSGGWIMADTLLFDARDRGMEAMGNVELVDSTQDIRVRTGWYTYSRKESLAVVAREPMLTKGQGDTAVVVVADSMRLDERTRRAVAWENVRIERGNLSAQCDSVLYDDRAQELSLFGAPRAVQRTESDTTATISRLFGDRITLSLNGTSVRRIEVEGAARGIASEVDSAGRPEGERWIVGRQIIFHIEDERVTQVEVFGQARSRYVPPSSARKDEGINEAAGDTFRINFQGTRMSSVRLRGGVQGIFWPPADSARDARSTSRGK